MTALLTNSNEVVEKLTETLDDALALLKDSRLVPEPLATLDGEPESLLEQCISLCAQHEALQPEPIRTLHHFACTGGTLISKCISAMPNTQVLSEVDPLSKLMDSASPRFAPTDMITLMRQSTRGVDQGLLIELFLNNIQLVNNNAIQNGLRLVIRDHAHSQYCSGTSVLERPSLREMVVEKFDVISLVTVRHPIDSYLSLRANGWVHFEPASIDEYAKRYMAFIEDYKGVPWIRYEDFVDDPQRIMKVICEYLRLPFNAEFVNLFDVFTLTGDSGRAGAEIKKKERRKVNDELIAEAESSPHYCELAGMLGYDY